MNKLLEIGLEIGLKLGPNEMTLFKMSVQNKITTTTLTDVISPSLNISQSKDLKLSEVNVCTSI